MKKIKSLNRGGNGGGLYVSPTSKVLQGPCQSLKYHRKELEKPWNRAHDPGLHGEKHYHYIKGLSLKCRFEKISFL